jgi:hypothetical protein
MVDSITEVIQQYEDRTSDTLMAVIRDWIEPGTTNFPSTLIPRSPSIIHRFGKVRFSGNVSSEKPTPKG